MKFIFALALFFLSDPYPKNENISVSHYVFKLELGDDTDLIKGEAEVTIRFIKPVSSFDLNLIQKKDGLTGMEILSIKSSGKPVEYSFKNDLVTIKPPPGSEHTFIINYQGIPADGLLISENKFGNRSFFGDNWPDRGRHWLPTVDHPSYKATVEFMITAPDHYEVVATGKLVEERTLTNNFKLSHWKESVPVSVKVMTIGVSEFSVKELGVVTGIPVTTWVYPQNKDAGFSDFAVAPRILEYMQEYIGPYPFEKLAHVQSKTKFGGLENAGNIFYFENVVTGKNERESLIAHETAHQWFGNSATEDDWHHVWLSEGFATYCTALYMEHTYGRDTLVSMMKKTRKQVFEFAKKNTAPIVDTTIMDVNKVLNTNTYQKAAWVLHMLRRKMGDESFHAGVREYYDTYKGRTAMTRDFIKVMQKYIPEDLQAFVRQWLYKGGHPKITGTWQYDQKDKAVLVELNSTAELLLDLKIGAEPVQTFELKQGKQTIKLKTAQKPTNLVADPRAWLLADIQIQAK